METICSTEMFFESMCHPEFVRLSHKKGKIGDNIYITNAPPESVDGFLDKKINDIEKNICTNRSLVGFLSEQFLKFIKRETENAG